MADHGNKQLRVEDALEYLDQVCCVMGVFSGVFPALRTVEYAMPIRKDDSRHCAALHLSC